MAMVSQDFANALCVRLDTLDSMTQVDAPQHCSRIESAGRSGRGEVLLAVGVGGAGGEGGRLGYDTGGQRRFRNTTGVETEPAL